VLLQGGCDASGPGVVYVATTFSFGLFAGGKF
jgi:hypothetical protein